MRTGTQWQNIVSTISHMCDIVDTMFCHCGSVTLCHTAYISGGIHRLEHQVCNNTIDDIHWEGLWYTNTIDNIHWEGLLYILIRAVTSTEFCTRVLDHV